MNLFNVPLSSPTKQYTTLNDVDYQYHNLLRNIIKNGYEKQNRTGVKTISVFGEQIKFKNITKNFPLLTTKKLHLKSVIGELLWFLSGSSNKHELKEKYGVSIWDEWGDDETGELGPVYGKQWRKWQGWLVNTETGKCGSLWFDQISQIVEQLKKNPDDRRIMVSAWNVADIDKMALPPCHYAFQIWTRDLNLEERIKIYEDNFTNGIKIQHDEWVESKLSTRNISKKAISLLWNQRSCDTFLGIPFNIASYAILLLMLAQQTNMYADELIGHLGDTHLYENHMEYVNQQLARDSKSEPPQMLLNKKDSIFDYTPEDFTLVNYESWPNWRNIPIAI
jgi:thymidylate synthase